MAARQYSELAQCVTSAVCEFRFHLTMSMIGWNRSSHQTLQGWKTNEQTTNDQTTNWPIEHVGAKARRNRNDWMNKWTNDWTKVQTNERMNDQTIERSNDWNKQTVKMIKRTNKQTKEPNEQTNETYWRKGIRNRGVQMKWIEQRVSSWSNLDTRNRGVTYSVHVQIYICVLVHIYRTYIKTNHM